MAAKKILILDIVTSIFLLFVCLAFFSFFTISTICSLRVFPGQSSKYTLEWLPQQYPRIEERFKVKNRQIRYLTTQGKATVYWVFPIKPIKPIKSWLITEVKSWHLSDQDSLVINYGIDYFASGIVFLFMFFSGVGVCYFSRRCFFQGKGLWRKRDLSLRDQEVV